MSSLQQKILRRHKFISTAKLFGHCKMLLHMHFKVIIIMAIQSFLGILSMSR